MSAITSDDYARKWSGHLVEKEAQRSGITLSEARARVARRIGASPGTLENLSRNRLKGVREWLFSKLLAAVLAETEREIAALQHEQRTLLALGRDADRGTLQAVEESLERLRAAMIPAA